MENTEAVVSTVHVYGKESMGCKRHDKDIMVTMITDPTEADKEQGHTMQFHDWFLTKEQAEYLLLQLTKRLEENK